MKHRIFIAVNLPKDIKQRLVDYQEKVEELFTPYRNEVSGSGPIRWTKIENLHITLEFLGYIADEELLEICKVTKEVVSKHKPFSVNLQRICYGPPKKMPPRMIWVEGERSQELAALRDDLEKALAGSAIRFSPEKRAFSPHLTLGRIRAWEFRQLELEERPEVEEGINLSFEVSSIEVMESQLKRGGAEYMVLESCQLKT